ncbi:MAG: zinc ABC transporter substrate-binding protein [Patescibacteria group bacterium]
MKRISLLLPSLLVLIAIALIIVLNLGEHRTIVRTNAPHRIRVTTTLFPLYDMARQIAGDAADVTLLLPPGVEPHTFEPKPSDVIAINEGDVFVYTGAFMEPWAKDVVNSVSNPHLIVVDASKGTTMIPAVIQNTDAPIGSLDPHIWLDFDNAKIMAKSIANAIIADDPSHADAYRLRLAAYEQTLSDLDAEYRTTIATCASKEIIYGGHYAFGYLAKRYGLTYIAAQGVSPDAEPTAQDLARLTDQIRKDKITTIFYEELTSPKVAQTIANETNAKLLPLNAAHNVSKDQMSRGTTFSDILREDLKNLSIGLQCQISQ